MSWADLIILAGNVALESMGVRLLGFAGGRVDAIEPDDTVNWGHESTWLDDSSRYGDNPKNNRQLYNPFGAVQMGLIYVNPEGPQGQPDPLASAHDIRETFARMAMNDAEPVALIAGGHTFGKCHGAAPAAQHVGPEPEGAPLTQQGLGWNNAYQTGKGADTITSGLEGAWTAQPTVWDHGYFTNLFEYDWELTKSPGGAYQWQPKQGVRTVPDAHHPDRQHAPIMLTSDLALLADPVYRRIAQHFYKNPQAFADAFARAWYKLTHRDLGPHVRLLGPEVPPPQAWQDPLPPPPPIFLLVDASDQAWLKEELLSHPELTVTRLVETAWASASTFRQTDKRGGANGGRLRLMPQRQWMVNQPAQLASTLTALQDIQIRFSTQRRPGREVSLADLIVLGGCAGVEAAAQAAGYPNVRVPFTPGRTDATQVMTDIESFAVLEPLVDGFRNFIHPKLLGQVTHPEQLLVEKAHMLSLTVSEMTVLLGGLRVLGIGTSLWSSSTGTNAFTHRVGHLTNDFFVNLLDMGTVWSETPSSSDHNLYYEGRNRTTGQIKWTGTRVDLIFGSHSVLRGLCEVHACDDGEERFVQQFCQAFAKVMDLDRFDVAALKLSVPSSRL